MNENQRPKLPKALETDPRAQAVEEILNQDLRPLWEQGAISVSHLALSPSLEKALIQAKVSRQLERGLEQIQKLLDNEELGLSASPATKSTHASGRVSRLLLIANDGTERFYRACESALQRHRGRLLGIRLLCSSEELATQLYGAGKSVKAILVSDKEAVASVLLSLLTSS